MKRITTRNGLGKKYFGPPLQQYCEQIRQVCERFGYKISGELAIILPNGDKWIYKFTENKEK